MDYYSKKKCLYVLKHEVERGWRQGLLMVEVHKILDISIERRKVRPEDFVQRYRRRLITLTNHLD